MKKNDSVKAEVTGSGIYSEVSLAYVYRVDCENAKMPRVMHRHESHIEFVFIAEGEGIYHIDHRKYEAKKGDVLLFDRGVLHDEVPSSDGAIVTYCVGLKTWDFHPQGLDGKMLCPVFHCQAEYLFLHPMFDVLFLAIQQKQKTGIVRHLLQALLLKIDECVKKHKNFIDHEEYHLAWSIKNYIDAHYHEPLTLREIAAAIKINECYLVHIFKAVVGYSPIQYITRRRIGEAQTLLINTRLSITDISLQMGYNNSSYFHKVFSKVVGISPSQYRKSWKRIHGEGSE